MSDVTLTPEDQTRRLDQLEEIFDAAGGLAKKLPTRDFDEFIEGLWSVVGLHLEQQNAAEIAAASAAQAKEPAEPAG